MTFWQQRKVLITGNTGFKGSWLSLWLQHLGADAVGYSIGPPTDPSLFELANVAADMRNVQGDVRDLDQLTSVFQEAQPEVVFHLAAQPLVRQSYAEPMRTFTTNVMGTLNMLEAVRHSESVRVVVTITSDKCYRNDGEDRGFRESDPMGGHDPYSGSKGCAELVTAAYRDSYFCPGNRLGREVAVASARAGNVFGGGDWAADRLVPDAIRAYARGESLQIRNPAARRPWQHVLEPLSGYLTLAEQLWNSPELAVGWNFGPPDEDAQPVGWVVDRLAQQWGDGAAWNHCGLEHPPEDLMLRLDCSQAHSRLGWHSRLPLSDGLQWTVDWFRQQLNQQDVHAVTLEQIRNYEALSPTRETPASQDAHACTSTLDS